MEISEKIKNNIRAVLLSQEGGISLSKFLKDYKDLVHKKLSFKTFGFKTLEEFIVANPDTARLQYSEKDHCLKIFGIGRPDSYMSHSAVKAQGRIPKSNLKQIQNKPLSYVTDYPYNTVLKEPLLPDKRGWFSLCFPKEKRPLVGSVKDFFSKAGNVVDVHETSKFIFVRFDCPKSVCYAFKIFPDLDLQLAQDNKKSKTHTDRKYQNDVSSERGYSRNKERLPNLPSSLSSMDATGHPDMNNGKLSQAASVSSSDSALDKEGKEVYIGNIENTTTKEEILSLLGNRHNFQELQFKKWRNSTFAFAKFASEKDAKALIADLNGLIFKGRPLKVYFSKKDNAKCMAVNCDLQLENTLENGSLHKLQVMPDFENEIPELEDEMPDLEDEMPGLEEDMPDLEEDMPDLEEDMPGLEEDMPGLEKDTSPLEKEGVYGSNRKSPPIFQDLRPTPSSQKPKTPSSQKPKTPLIDPCIFVANFKDGTTERELMAMFLRYHPKEVFFSKIIGGCNKAVVRLCSLEDVHNAVREMNQQLYMGFKLFVDIYDNKKHPVQLSETKSNDENITLKTSDLLKLRGLILNISSTKEPALKLSQRLEVLITSVISNTFFWGQIVNYSKNMRLLKEISDKINSPQNYSEMTEQSGQCLAVFEGDGLWYRAWLIHRANAGTSGKVFFMDYGNVANVSNRNITGAKDLLVWTLYPLAVPITLTEPVMNLKTKELTHITIEVAAQGTQEEGNPLFAKPISLFRNWEHHAQALLSYAENTVI